jgi:phosphopantothenoylcysteine decarboxylase/phosphopantothenate--cysteine ligase
MLEAGLQHAPNQDLIVGAAAVADYRPTHTEQGKVRRSESPLSLDLIANPDVIAEIAKSAPNARVIGFAAEPSSDLEEVRQKIDRKRLFAIAANDISRSDVGFESDRNELRLVGADGTVLESGVQTKLGCALWLLSQVAIGLQ